MPISTIYERLRTIARREFADIVLNATVQTLSTDDPLKLRLDVIDGSVLDVFLSESGRYSYHLDRRLLSPNEIYRHDNAPHARWRSVASFPKHFHDGSEERVTESSLSSNPEEGIREFLRFVRMKLGGET